MNKIPKDFTSIKDTIKDTYYAALRKTAFSASCDVCVLRTFKRKPLQIVISTARTMRPVHLQRFEGDGRSTHGVGLLDLTILISAHCVVMIYIYTPMAFACDEA